MFRFIDTQKSTWPKIKTDKTGRNSVVNCRASAACVSRTLSVTDGVLSHGWDTDLVTFCIFQVVESLLTTEMPFVCRAGHTKSNPGEIKHNVSNRVCISKWEEMCKSEESVITFQDVSFSIWMHRSKN